MPDQPSITCPTCGMTSYSHGDINHRYCGKCHAYHRDHQRGYWEAELTRKVEKLQGELETIQKRDARIRLLMEDDES